MTRSIRLAFRFLDLFRRDDVTVAAVEGVIGRGRGRLVRCFNGSTYALEVRADERKVLAGFFGVPVAGLGG